VDRGGLTRLFMWNLGTFKAEIPSPAFHYKARDKNATAIDSSSSEDMGGLRSGGALSENVLSMNHQIPRWPFHVLSFLIIRSSFNLRV